MGMTIILARVECCLKVRDWSKNQATSSLDGNIKAGWHDLGYWSKGNIFRGLVENVNIFAFSMKYQHVFKVP